MMQNLIHCPSDSLLVVRPDTGPCGRCSEPGHHVVRDPAQVEKVLCGRCLERIRVVCGMKVVAEA